VRKYPGWHHHMLTTMLAHFFLWRLKLRLGEKRSGAAGVPATDHLGRGLTPADAYDSEVLALVTWGQQRNHRAYLTHRKRRETEGEMK
jgi:hypothetical protein